MGLSITPGENDPAPESNNENTEEAQAQRDATLSEAPIDVLERLVSEIEEAPNTPTIRATTINELSVPIVDGSMQLRCTICDHSTIFTNEDSMLNAIRCTDCNEYICSNCSNVAVCEDCGHPLCGRCRIPCSRCRAPVHLNCTERDENRNILCQGCANNMTVQERDEQARRVTQAREIAVSEQHFRELLTRTENIRQTEEERRVQQNQQEADARAGVDGEEMRRWFDEDEEIPF